MRKLFVALFFGLLALDQLVKWWARVAANGVEGRSLNALWPGVFELKLVYNEGIAFGMLQGAGVLLAPIAIIMAVAATIYSFKNPKERLSMHIAMACLASGAIGNLIDRLAMGKVTDMFWIRAINFPVFNIADVAITVAGCMLVLNSIYDAFTHKKEEETELAAESVADQPEGEIEPADDNSVQDLNPGPAFGRTNSPEDT